MDTHGTRPRSAHERPRRGKGWGRGACIALVAVVFVAAGCGATTGQYGCEGDEQCELARACAPKCDVHYGWDDRCARFAADAPDGCSEFVGMPQYRDHRVQVKRDPFR